VQAAALLQGLVQPGQMALALLLVQLLLVPLLLLVQLLLRLLDLAAENAQRVLERLRSPSLLSSAHPQGPGLRRCCHLEAAHPSAGCHPQAFGHQT